MARGKSEDDGIVGFLTGEPPSRTFTPEPKKDRLDIDVKRRLPDDYYGSKEKREAGYNKTNPGKAGIAAIKALLRDLIANSEALAKATGIGVILGDVQFDKSGGKVSLRFAVRDAEGTHLTWQGSGGVNMLDPNTKSLLPDKTPKPKKKKTKKKRVLLRLPARKK